jgi:putative lipoprotein
MKQQLQIVLAIASLMLTGCASVQMEQLNGTVNYRERIALPAETEVRVALEDVTHADKPAKLVAEQVIHPSTHSVQQVPIPFSLNYDGRAIEAKHQYRLVADIRDAANRELWRSTEIDVDTKSAADAAPIDPFAISNKSSTNKTGPIEIMLKRVGEADKPLPSWHYRCDDIDFTFVPGNDDKAGLYFDNRMYKVKRVPSAAGARYEGDGAMFWSKGRDGMLSLGGKNYEGCTGESQ